MFMLIAQQKTDAKLLLFVQLCSFLVKKLNKNVILFQILFIFRSNLLPLRVETYKIPT